MRTESIIHKGNCPTFLLGQKYYDYESGIGWYVTVHGESVKSNEPYLVSLEYWIGENFRIIKNK